MNVGNEETAHDVYNACNGDDEVADGAHVRWVAACTQRLS
jgi:hypothetical protein